MLNSDVLYLCTVMFSQVKKISSAFVSALLVALLLFGSSSISLNRMMCLFTGSTQYGLFSVGDYIPGEAAEGTNLFAKCCDFTQTGLALTEFETTTTKKVSAIGFATVVAAFSLSNNTEFYSINQQNIHVFADLPPPLRTADRLATGQIYRL